MIKQIINGLIALFSKDLTASHTESRKPPVLIANKIQIGATANEFSKAAIKIGRAGISARAVRQRIISTKKRTGWRPSSVREIPQGESWLNNKIHNV